MQKNSYEKPKRAVALKYDRQKDDAPKVVASGKGYVAETIIKLAQENNIFIKKDEDLVELLSKVEVNKEIPDNMYKAIAEIFSFIYKMSNKDKLL
ncbi:MAG: EscU/YscU/HrcU family type III secretion system export apparatus switch protein [Sulfurospirillaceae bacterium]|nr:EscU/YscU/HrcU family type III secretion system export apparatus switch protein [Sulfurospirillaceae bacterium]MDD3462309.1 EscU/YscU/HrcU family type III secretion system export apparatus switch protein [Sulfurospirillaceae bacterium]